MMGYDHPARDVVGRNAPVTVIWPVRKLYLDLLLFLHFRLQKGPFLLIGRGRSLVKMEYVIYCIGVQFQCRGSRV